MIILNANKQDIKEWITHLSELRCQAELLQILFNIKRKKTKQNAQQL